MKTSGIIPTSFTRPLALSLAMLGMTGAAVTAATFPALAQEVQAQQPGDADAQNDEVTIDALGRPYGAHMVRGTVASFSPYRILLAQGPERTVQVDLNKGTAILPEGTTITPGMNLAVHGAWSKGVFVADRVMLRRDGD